MNRILSLLVIAALLLTAFAAAPAAAQSQATLVVWDDFSREADQPMIEQLDKEFEAAHSGVTIKRETYTTADITTILPTALTESTGPDVAKINQGYTGMGGLVKADLLLPLDQYADKYKWWDRYAKGLHLRNSFSADGKQMGVGNLYSLSHTAEVVGVFYHKKDFADLGLKIPATFAEFETLLQTVKDKGKTPMVFGSLDGWPAIHLYSAIQDAYSTTDALDKFIYRLPGGTFDDKANLTAAQKLVEWADKGYLSAGFAGMDYDNATTSGFLNNEGLMWITGTWIGATIIPKLGEDGVGFFLVPPSEKGNPPLSVGGLGLGYGIRKTSKNADLAAEYIDFITGSHAAEVMLGYGYLPAIAVDAKALKAGTLTADMVNAWQTISKANAVGHYLDWTLPDIAANIQELMAKQVTPEDFVKKVQADYVAGAAK
jgi:raffinose/stachyose/melibiose transport system substrate-binding protein